MVTGLVDSVEQSTAECYPVLDGQAADGPVVPVGSGQRVELVAEPADLERGVLQDACERPALRTQRAVGCLEDGREDAGAFFHCLVAACC